MIAGMLNDSRKLALAALLNGERVETVVDNRISLQRLFSESGDEAFYSLLVQAGYLALEEKLPERGTAVLSIPNRELMIVWREFILKSLYSSSMRAKTLFDHADNLNEFASDLEYFLSDRLSYHDLAVYQGEDPRRAMERVYHVFMLGLLSAYADVRCRYPQSNRESGDGRYDILVEKPEGNFIFEFKVCDEPDDLDAKAAEALTQIEAKRYGADLEKGGRLVKIGAAFCGKRCRVKAVDG